MKRFLKNLIGAAAKTSRCQASLAVKRKTHLEVECLEGRELMSVAPLPALPPMAGVAAASGKPMTAVRSVTSSAPMAAPAASQGVIGTLAGSIGSTSHAFDVHTDLGYNSPEYPVNKKLHVQIDNEQIDCFVIAPISFNLIYFGISARRVNGTPSQDHADGATVTLVGDAVPRAGIQASLDGNVLMIAGTDGPDNIFVGQSHDQIAIEGVPILVNGSFRDSVYAGSVGQITVFGLGGDDHILLDRGDQDIYAKCIIDGGAGTDFVAGARGGRNEYFYSEFIADEWALNGRTPMEDVRQGKIGNCSVLASLASAALRGADLTDRIHYNGNFRYSVDLYDKSGQLQKIQVGFTGSVASDDPRPYDDHIPNTPKPDGPWEFWTILYRRAYLQMSGEIDDGVDPGEVVAALTGHAAPPLVLSGGSANDAYFVRMDNAIKEHRNVVAATDHSFVYASLIPNHAYTVVSVQRDALGKPFSVTVRNPWGFDGGTPSGDPNDGLIVLSWADYQGDMTRLWIECDRPVDPLSDKYQQLGGPNGFLGSPAGPELTAPDGVGHYEYFQNGAIYWSPATGAHEIHGTILQEWASLKWEQGILGYPTTDEVPTPDGQARANFFQGGAIYCTPHNGTHEVHGPILQEWVRMGMERGVLGYPTTDQWVTPDGMGRYTVFQGGSIYWSPTTGAHEVHGVIRGLWAQLGWEKSFLGYPLTGETIAPDGVGHYSVFQGGSIYWSPQTGVHEVHGAIRGLWAQLGWEKSFLGYPLTNETIAPDGIGRYSVFQGGSIYWSPQTGAHEVHGAIRDKWASLGWERGVLGYPASDEYDFQGGRRSNFQHGYIFWTRYGGAQVVRS